MYDPVDKKVLESLTAHITQPWQGTMTDLVAHLDLGNPDPFRLITGRRLTAVITRLLASGALDGWHFYRWRAADRRMVFVTPPGWRFDTDQGCWIRLWP